MDILEYFIIMTSYQILSLSLPDGSDNPHSHEATRYYALPRVSGEHDWCALNRDDTMQDTSHSSITPIHHLALGWLPFLPSAIPYDCHTSRDMVFFQVHSQNKHITRIQVSDSVSPQDSFSRKREKPRNMSQDPMKALFGSASASISSPKQCR